MCLSDQLPNIVEYFFCFYECLEMQKPPMRALFNYSCTCISLNHHFSNARTHFHVPVYVHVHVGFFLHIVRRLIPITTSFSLLISIFNSFSG